MIDSKPIKPTYLDLIPLKHFAKREQEALRGEMKEQREDTSKDNAMGQINWSKMLTTELQDRMKERSKALEEFKR